jgi:ABC-2 type transport system ATP-binding protein
MRASTTIEFTEVSKSFGAVRAVDGLTFSVQPGQVTGFLGPNGAGKTTTLRMLLGLVAPTSGTATFGGVAYRNLERPLATVGTALEASSFHPGRSATNHLRIYALAAGISLSRIGEVLATVGLEEYADRRVAGYSLGMRQRLGLAFALLGDPAVLVLDEPTNGLDPEGILWMRGLLRELADEGRTVLVSSHQLSEVQQSVDRVVIISRGKSVYAGTLAGLESGSRILVDSPDRSALRAALIGAGATVEETPEGLAATGLTASEAGVVALKARVALNLLSPEQASLEHVFLELVGSKPSRALPVTPPQSLPRTKSKGTSA